MIVGDRLLIGEAHVPGKVDPCVLADLGDERIDQRPALRLGIDGREMRPGQHGPDHRGRLAGIGQINDDEHTFAAVFAQGRGHLLQAG